MRLPFNKFKTNLKLMNKRHLIILILCVFNTHFIFGQKQKESIRNIHRIDIFAPGYEYETPVFNNFYFNAGIRSDITFSARRIYNDNTNGFTPWYENYVDQNNNYTAIILLPYLESGIRWNYNQLRREERGKSSVFNSGNYLKLSSRFYPDNVFVPIYVDNIEKDPNINGLRFSLIWGIRRSIKDRFIFDFYFGAEMNIFSPQDGIRGLFGIRFGLPIFNK